jgi:AAA lid domain/ATPase family associated with various cellular activities (AAA)
VAGAPAITAGPLDLPVDQFVTEIGSALDQLARSVRMVRADALAGDVGVEAFNLAAAFVDADGAESDDELWALISAFAGRMGTGVAGATPADLRTAGTVDGKRSWIETPSPLFELLVDADRRNGTSNAWHYYDLAMRIAHTVCSVDLVTSQAELSTLERYRTSLLAAMEAAGLRNPWTGRTPLSGQVVAEPVPAVAAASAVATAAAVAAAAPLPPPRPIEELLAELDGLVGLAEVKAEVRLVANLIRVQQLRRQRHLAVAEAGHHLVFTGNPGTGKTTVARLIGQIYRTLGVVKKGQLVETERAGLVAGYMGQTALKTTEVFESASGGLLLIDEAYALVRGREGDFGEEAIDTLVKLMEDRRDEVVVIAAGYPDEMAEFLDANPGLRSRFPRTIHFPDYSTDELVAIFEAMCHDNAYQLTPEALVAVKARFDAEPRGKGFGNGRLARNLFEAAVGRQASRIVAQDNPTDAELCTLLPDDVAGAGTG